MSLFDKLNDPAFLKEFNDRPDLTQEQWDIIHENVEKEHKKILEDHKAIEMTYEKYIKPFGCIK